ncbi:MAG: hypothetical protein IBX55_06255 [Methyloprofundus sp.]|nr:hypothetical protein [Methyloprofundus sp.]
MNLEVFLSLFTLMLVSLLIYILAQKTKVPYTVLLVPLSNTEMFGFIFKARHTRN